MPIVKQGYYDFVHALKINPKSFVKGRKFKEGGDNCRDSIARFNMIGW